MKEKQYIIIKYIIAKNAIEAIKKEKNFCVDEIWIDEDWKKEHVEIGQKIKGFSNN